MSRLNPRVDFAFKKLFGSEGNKDILISFINSIVSPQDKVADITLVNPYNDPQFKGDKLSILDIKAIDETGRHYNIEMQMVEELSYDQRALYYWSKVYTCQLKEGCHFDTLSKTIGIHVLNFNYFNEEKDYHNVFKILNAKTHQACFEDFELHFIELEKFDKELSALKSTLDRWTNFLKKAEAYSIDKMPQELAQEPAIKKAIEVLDTLHLTEAELQIYEGQLKWLRDEATAVRNAERRGLEQGLEQGVKQGLEQGEVKGRLEGKLEGRIEEKRETAKKLLAKGIDIDTIIEITQLEHKEVLALQEKSKG